MLLRSATEQRNLLRDRKRDTAASKNMVERRMRERGKEIKGKYEEN
jgi:hypothetical protein